MPKTTVKMRKILRVPYLKAGLGFVDEIACARSKCKVGHVDYTTDGHIFC